MKTSEKTSEMAIATAIGDLAYQVRALGNGNASTSMGAVEGHAVKVGEGLTRLATSVDDVTGPLYRIADAIELVAKALTGRVQA